MNCYNSNDPLATLLGIYISSDAFSLVIILNKVVKSDCKLLNGLGQTQGIIINVA